MSEFLFNLFGIWYYTLPFSLLIFMLHALIIGLARDWENYVTIPITILTVIGAILIWPFPQIAYIFIPIGMTLFGFILGVAGRIYAQIRQDESIEVE
ncbi:hypothetical protein ACFL1A_00695 [Patescibacteria group bacterium]